MKYKIAEKTIAVLQWLGAFISPALAFTIAGTFIYLADPHKPWITGIVMFIGGAAGVAFANYRQKLRNEMLHLVKHIDDVIFDELEYNTEECHVLHVYEHTPGEEKRGELLLKIEVDTCRWEPVFIFYPQKDSGAPAFTQSALRKIHDHGAHLARKEKRRLEAEANLRMFS